MYIYKSLKNKTVPAARTYAFSGRGCDSRPDFFAIDLWQKMCRKMHIGALRL